jgi:nitrosocyanin
MRLAIRPLIFFFSLSSALSLSSLVAQAGSIREFTVVNIETPQSVKIWEPTTLVVKKGETVKLKLINKAEQEHGYRIAEFKVEKIIQSGQAETVEFTADREGIFTIDCQLHPAHVQGQLIVLP